MTDIFNNTILCKKCNEKMKRVTVFKEGFSLRAMICERCGERIFHPVDEKEYNDFQNLKKKIFKVKLRLVGNSYAVSIPKQIIDFINEQEKRINELVSLTLEKMGKISINFEEDEN